MGAMAREIGRHAFEEDYVSKVSRRSGHRLVLLTDDARTETLGFVVYRFGESRLVIFQLAVAEKHRRKGFGKKLVRWLVQYAQKQSLKSVGLSSLVEAIPFYKRLGFRKRGAPTDCEDYVPGQVYMERAVKKS